MEKPTQVLQSLGLRHVGKIVSPQYSNRGAKVNTANCLTKKVLERDSLPQLKKYSK